MCDAPKPGHRGGGPDGVREGRGDPDPALALLAEIEKLGALVALGNSVEPNRFAGRRTRHRRPGVKPQTRPDVARRDREARSPGQAPDSPPRSPTRRPPWPEAQPGATGAPRAVGRHRRHARHAPPRCSIRVARMSLILTTASPPNEAANARRQQHLGHVLLGVVGTPELAETALATPHAVVLAAALRESRAPSSRAREPVVPVALSLGDLGCTEDRALPRRRSGAKIFCGAPDDAVLPRPPIQNLRREYACIGWCCEWSTPHPAPHENANGHSRRSCAPPYPERAAGSSPSSRCEKSAAV